MKKIIKNINTHKLFTITLVFLLLIFVSNLQTVFYSFLSLYYFIIGLFSDNQILLFAEFFLEYWIASIYLVLTIIIIIYFLLRKKSSKHKIKLFFTKKIKEEYSNNKIFRIHSFLIYVFISIGILAPLIAPEDPLEITNTTVNKYLPPISSKQYIRYQEFSFDNLNYHYSEKDNYKTLLNNCKYKIKPNFERIYFDSLKIVNNKIIFYQGLRAKEILAVNLNLETANIEKSIFILGTDSYGRDLLSRIIFGTRISLGVAFIASLVSLLLGIILGLFSGYFNRFVDSLLMRMTDIFLSFPVIFLLLIIVAIFGNSFFLIALFIGFTTWMDIARLTRAEVITVKNEIFVLSLKALGFPSLKILYKHILPNVITPIIINTIFRLGTIILMESALSFIGLGVNEPTPSWGNIINNGKDNLLNAWWISFFPGLTITLVVLIFNYIGDCLKNIIKIK